MSAAQRGRGPRQASAKAKPPGIRPGLLIVLVVIVAATAWSLMQGDDSDVHTAKRTPGASSPADRADGADSTVLPAGARSLRSAREAAQDGADAPIAGASAALQRLSEQVAWWQARGNFAPLGEAGNAAWASKLPPPPPPPKPMPPPPPPPPVAPRFPYQWVGSWQEAAQAEPAASSARGAGLLNMAVISGPNQTWVVKAGDVIEGQWRVDAVTQRAVQLTYLPLSQTQTIFMRRT